MGAALQVVVVFFTVDEMSLVFDRLFFFFDWF